MLLCYDLQYFRLDSNLYSKIAFLCILEYNIFACVIGVNKRAKGRGREKRVQGGYLRVMSGNNYCGNLEYETC